VQLPDYGTGVVQGCPAHDDRDFEFAKKVRHTRLKRDVEGEPGATTKFVEPEKVKKLESVKLNHGH
jgi:leucyl-tRNA synthetase